MAISASPKRIRHISLPKTGMSSGAQPFESSLSQLEVFETAPSQLESDIIRKIREQSKL
jgi:hypothetical protein